MLLIHGQPINDLRFTFATQGFKVGEGAEVNVRRVVPGVRQELGNRHAALARQVPAAPPVAEVGEGDDALATDAQHFLEDPVRVVHRLQRLGHDHDIETVAGKVAQALVQVLFDDVDALGHALGDVVRVVFQAVAGDLLVVAQPGQQFAIAAPEVEHAAAGGDPFLDDFQISSHGYLTT
ncbi:hypothetical protein D3C84_472420 [compost metagenome]